MRTLIEMEFREFVARTVTAGVVTAMLVTVGGWAFGQAYSAVTAPVTERLKQETMERVAADQRLTSTLQLQQQYLKLDTRRLDAIGVLLTTPATSQAHRAAAVELEELRKMRSQLGFGE